MFERRAGWSAVLGVLLLICWAMIAGLLIPRIHAAGTGAAPAGIRSHSQTFVSSEFRQAENGYLSPVERVSFPFTAAGVCLKSNGMAALVQRVELRLRSEAEDWSPWFRIDGLEPESDGRLCGENLVAWSQAREAQARIQTWGSLQEAIHSLTIVAIDASDGPTTAQAAHSARIRTASQTRATQDAPGVPLPVVISRAEWGADESWMTWSPYYAPVDKVVVHHTVSGGGDDPAAEVRAIYYYHAVTRGWGDVGYNFLVDRFGNVYEGRYGGPDVIGAHVAYWNEGSMGVSVLGCYDNRACNSSRIPAPATMTALADLTAWQSSRQAIDPRALQDFDNGYTTVTNYTLSGHRDFGSTVCPGGNLYVELPDLREMTWERLPRYDVRFDWHDTPSSLEAGQQVTVHINLYNHGRFSWSDRKDVRLGYRWIKDEQVVAENTAAAHIIPDAEVNFGEMTALVAQLTVPNASGPFTLRWDLYRDDVGWFADQPALEGRSQPLDLIVEVASLLSLDVQLASPSVAAGAPLHIHITLQGDVGQAFQARTSLPQGVRYVVGSGRSDVGGFRLAVDDVTWAGTLSVTATKASFDTLVSSELEAPLALSTTTVLTSAGHVPLAVTRWFIVNGYHSYLPVVDRAWTD